LGNTAIICPVKLVEKAVLEFAVPKPFRVVEDEAASNGLVPLVESSPAMPEIAEVVLKFRSLSTDPLWAAVVWTETTTVTTSFSVWAL
jgi:hypothetical protein